DDRDQPAILRARAADALKQGDRRTAEVCWGQLLDLMLAKPAIEEAAAAPGEEKEAAAPDDAPAPPSPPPPKSTAPAQTPPVPVVTTTQFSQALEMARLAADNSMAALSLRAVRDALRGGPPIQVASENPRPGMYAVGGAPAPEGEGAVAQQVEER